MNADGTNLVQLTDLPTVDMDPSWSPDGSKIVFTSERSGIYEIWMMNADGSNPIQLTTSEGNAGYPAWQPGSGE